MDITILELHLPEAQFNAPFSSSESSKTSDEASTAEPTEASGSKPSIAPLAVLLMIIGLAAIARYLRKSSQAELDEFGGS